MVRTEQQQLLSQLARLYLVLRDYQQVQAHPPCWINTQALAIAIEQIELDISSLETQLEFFITPPSIYFHNKSREAMRPN